VEGGEKEKGREGGKDGKKGRNISFRTKGQFLFRGFYFKIKHNFHPEHDKSCFASFCPLKRTWLWTSLKCLCIVLRSNSSIIKTELTF
jgi:hypothetical protein